MPQKFLIQKSVAKKSLVSGGFQLKYSVVVPVFNEKGSISSLHDEILAVMRSLKDSFEIIYVDDGSTDGSGNVLSSLRGCKVIILNRNYGQATALDAGFKASKGEFVISLDGDGQNDPRDIPKLLDKLLKDDLDVVAGWRFKRKDNSGIRILTRTGRLLRRILIKDKVHDTGCTLRVYRSVAVKSLDIQGEMHRYILALLRWKGFLIGELRVNHRSRVHGNSKYGPRKAIRGFIDLVHVWFINKYSQRPLHMFGALGILSFFFGLVIGARLAYLKVVYNISLSDTAWFIVGIFLMVTGGFLFCFGIIIETLLRIHLNTSPFERRYYIREILVN